MMLFARLTELGTAHFKHVLHLDQEYSPQPWTSAAWDEAQQAGGQYFLGLALKEAELLGFALYQQGPHDSVAHLLKVVIVPSHRRQGLALALLQESQKQLQKLGSTSLFLEVSEMNQGALGLYQKLGMNCVHRVPRFYSNGEGAQRMEQVFDL